MKKIVLLSGHSQRFIDKGYTVKPLIDIKGRLIIDYVIDCIKEPEETYENYIFVLKTSDVINYNIDKVILDRFKGCSIEIIPDHRDGPVYSTLRVAHRIADDEEVLVSYCDLHIKWDVTKFLDHIKQSNCDGCVVSHGGWHPHRVYNQYFAYMKVDGDIMNEIQEKKPYTDNPEAEFASGGIYYFRKGSYVKTYFKNYLDANIRVNNEFYVTMVYNQMVKDGLKITHFDSGNYVCLGTPKDVEIFRSYLYLNEEFDVDAATMKRAAEYFKQYK